MEKITYSELIEKLKMVDLHINPRKWEMTEEKEVLLEASVVGKNQNEGPQVNKGAVYGWIICKAKNPDELAQKIFNEMTTGNVLIGAYGSFETKIVFTEGKFIKQNLSSEESYRFNLD